MAITSWDQALLISIPGRRTTGLRLGSSRTIRRWNQLRKRNGFKLTAGSNSTTSDVAVLRRLDYVINRENVLVVVGQSNGNSTTLPKLLGQSYNALSVGRSDGNHAHGFTTDDGSGRIKPEIVSPNTATSWATPTVGSAAALLLETAIVEGNADAEENETVRALLMAGATKLEFVDVWDRTTSRPLDDHYGAGELNIYRSYQILASGQQAASDTADVALNGWGLSYDPVQQQLFLRSSDGQNPG